MYFVVIRDNQGSTYATFLSYTRSPRPFHFSPFRTLGTKAGHVHFISQHLPSLPWCKRRRYHTLFLLFRDLKKRKRKKRRKNTTQLKTRCSTTLRSGEGVLPGDRFVSPLTSSSSMASFSASKVLASSLFISFNYTQQGGEKEEGKINMRTATGSEDNTIMTNNDMAWVGRGDGLQLTHIFNRFPPKGHYLPTGVNNQL